MAQEGAGAEAGVQAFWRRSVVSTLYAALLTRVLPQGCLCVRWLPGVADVPGSAPCMVEQRLLLGTRWSEDEPGEWGGGGGPGRSNWLVVLEAVMPSPRAWPEQQGAYPTIPPGFREAQVGAARAAGGRVPTIAAPLGPGATPSTIRSGGLNPTQQSHCEPQWWLWRGAPTVSWTLALERQEHQQPAATAWRRHPHVGPAGAVHLHTCLLAH